MRFSILEFGTFEVDSNIFLKNSTVATRSNPNAPHSMIGLPVWAALIQGAGHNIIYDLGVMDGAMTPTGWRPEVQERTPYYPIEGGTMVERLATLGLTPQDIDTVIVSHLHIDHFGQIDKFCHCDVYVPAEEWHEALAFVFGNADESTHTHYYKKQLTLPVKEYHPVPLDGDFELFPGLRIITLPGHTSNLLGLMVTTDSGKSYIFPSDAVYSPKNFGPPVRVPGTCGDEKSYKASCEKIRRLIHQTGAELIYSHDYETFKMLKKAPAFYD